MSTYNHDIDLDVTFARGFPRIRRLLRQPTVVCEFGRFDKVAIANKVRFHALGTLSLFLGALSLLGLCVQLWYKVATQHDPHLLHLATHVAALAAFLLAFFIRLFKVKHKYLNACFARERIRQWHFQLFLDGELVERLVIGDKHAIAELTRRWESLLESFRNLDGTVNDFLSRPHVSTSLFHPVTSYSLPEVATEVMEALKTIRIDHQVQYPERRITTEQGDHYVTLRNQLDWPEFVSHVALATAVGLAALGLILAITDSYGFTGSTQAASALAILALASAVICAATHAYQAGTTSPTELDSYTETVTQMDYLRTIFNQLPHTIASQQMVLEKLELAAASELRRFLTIKRHATFLL
nr:hypothetical protein [Nitrosomonas nitrosa]